MLLKLLLFIGVIGAVYYLFFAKKRTLPPSSDEPDPMIPCSTCGTYVDVKEALIRDGRFYCSRECMEVKK